MLVGAGQYKRALGVAKLALAMAEKTADPGHPDLALSLSTLGNIHRKRGEMDQADALLHRAMTITQRADFKEIQTSFLTRSNMGLLYLDRGEYEKAEPLLKSAVAVWEKIA